MDDKIVPETASDAGASTGTTDSSNAAGPSRDGVGSEPSTSAEHFRTRFRIEPHPEAGCQLLSSGGRKTHVRQAILDREGDSKCACRVEITGDEGSQDFLERTVTCHCICPVFSNHDCIATVDSVESDELVVSLTVPDRDELAAIVSSLREVGATPRLLQISSTTDEPNESVFELDTDSITNKQREAVRAAIRSGYYDTPRKADLEELADQLGISRSAVSQRLTAVESELVTRLFEVDEGHRPEKS